MLRLETHIGSLRLPNPVMVASGCWGWGEEAASLLPLNRLGAFVTKSVTLHAREGNPPPRIAETASGLLNSIGLENGGLADFLTRGIPLFHSLQVPLVVSIAAECFDDYAMMAVDLAKEERVDALEVNISCPNVERGCLVGSSPALTGDLVRLLRPLFPRALIIKLTPDAPDVPAVARAAQRGGADAIALCNTFRGMAVDVRSRRSRLATPTAGLSGPAIKPLALRMVWEVCQAVSLPVVGMGGIETGEDAAEFLLVGASAVQIGTAGFRCTDAPFIVLDELVKLLEELRLNCIDELIGRFTA